MNGRMQKRSPPGRSCSAGGRNKSRCRTRRQTGRRPTVPGL